MSTPIKRTEYQLDLGDLGQRIVDVSYTYQGKRVEIMSVRMYARPGGFNLDIINMLTPAAYQDMLSEIAITEEENDVNEQKFR